MKKLLILSTLVLNSSLWAQGTFESGRIWATNNSPNNFNFKFLDANNYNLHYDTVSPYSSWDIRLYPNDQSLILQYGQYSLEEISVTLNPYQNYSLWFDNLNNFHFKSIPEPSSFSIFMVFLVIKGYFNKWNYIFVERPRQVGGYHLGWNKYE